MAKGKEGRLMVRDFRNDERKRCTELQIQDVSHWKSGETLRKLKKVVIVWKGLTKATEIVEFVHNFGC